MKRWQIATVAAAIAVTFAGVWGGSSARTPAAAGGIIVLPATVVTVNGDWRPAGAPAKPQPPAAAPGLQAAPGAVLFSSDFNAGSTADWQPSVLPTSEQPGVWLVQDGAIEMRGDVNLDTPLDEAYFVARPAPPTAFYFEANILPRSGEGTGLVWNVQGSNFYRLQLYYNLPNPAAKAALERVQAGRVTLLAQAPVAVYPGYTPNVWQTARVRSVAGRQQVWVDGEPLFDVQDSALQGGAVGLFAWADSHARFDNVRVSAAGR
ncbi:MAG: DUF1080 domain-containing protein [Chloroflexota bacterium]|nr:DUF1080 domain-containing protein [Chloroflexota bacterium]